MRFSKMWPVLCFALKEMAVVLLLVLCCKPCLINKGEKNGSQACR